MNKSSSDSSFQQRPQGSYESSPEFLAYKMSVRCKKVNCGRIVIKRSKRVYQLLLLLIYLFASGLLLVANMKHSSNKSVTYQTLLKVDTPMVNIAGSSRGAWAINGTSTETSISDIISGKTYPRTSESKTFPKTSGSVIPAPKLREVMPLLPAISEGTFSQTSDTVLNRFASVIVETEVIEHLANKSSNLRTREVKEQLANKSSNLRTRDFKGQQLLANKSPNLRSREVQEQRANKPSNLRSPEMTTNARISTFTKAKGPLYSFVENTTWLSVKRLQYEDNMLHEQPGGGRRETTTREESLTLESPAVDISMMWDPATTVLEDQVTVVTAYFDIGSFKKGYFSTFTPRLYRQWMKIFSRIVNPLVVYVDTISAFEYMKEIRSFKTNTKILLVNRTEMWSFQLLGKTINIFSQPMYPKFNPNTKVPLYPCVMHAKFEVLNLSISQNYFSTKYFMWLDVGLFRNLQNVTEDFGLYLPPHFNESKVAYGEVYPYNGNRSFREIIYGNHLWVGGACNLARWDVMLEFVEQYRRYLNLFLSRRLMDTDQQIIYAMYVKEGRRFRPTVEIQPYQGGWFGLGYICKRSWEEKHRQADSSGMVPSLNYS